MEFSLALALEFIIALRRKEVRFFWGYRNHVISDALSELPLTETTRPANVQESKLFIPLFTQIREGFNIPIKGILGDSIYDAEYILDFIINDLKVKPYLARNPRWEETIIPPKTRVIVGVE
jgi:hypothetical protein